MDILAMVLADVQKQFTAREMGNNTSFEELYS